MLAIFTVFGKGEKRKPCAGTSDAVAESPIVCQINIRNSDPGLANAPLHSGREIPNLSENTAADSCDNTDSAMSYHWNKLCTLSNPVR